PSKLARLDPQLLYTLAAQRIYDLLGINNENSIFPNEDNIKQNSCKTKKDTSKTLNIPESCIRARAVLTPCDGTNGYETRMHYRQLTVGTSPDCHLCLANYNLSLLNNQKCSFISQHHATIFYDDWTQHYELINYSEYGTRSSDLVHRVRNLIKTAPKELSPNYQTSSVISELCDSPPKRLMKMLSKRHEDLSHMTSICDCTSLHFTQNDKFLVDKTDSSFDLITGWEGSAILRHGSMIQFGCYKFIFSLVNHSLPSYPSSTSSSTTCFYAPLLPCDYCSSCFHLECLNPPLSHFPPRSDRWMCPNHTEHTTERYLTRSIRLTERMQIWTKLYSSLNNENNHYEQSIDKTDEMTKILEHIPPYELTYTPDEESSILSDLMRTIQRSRNEQQQQQYQLLSSNLSNTAMSSIFDSILYTTNNTTTIKDKQHILSNLKRIPRINESSNVYQLTNLLDSSSTDEKSIFVRGLLQFYLQNTLQLPTQSSNLIQPDGSSSTMISDTSDTIVTTNATQLSISSSFETTPIAVTTTAIDSQINDNNISSSLVIDNKTTDTLKLTTDSIDMNTGNNSSILPYNTEQISKDPSFIQDDNEHLCNSFEQLNTAIMKKFNNITDNNSIPSKLARLDPQLLYTLAAQRIYDLLGINNENSIFPNEDNIKQNSCKTKKDTSKTLNIPESCIRARAVLTPCDGTNGYETRMHYRQLTVGTSPDCHLCLANYNLSSLNNQKCSFISSHHATIFYDDWTQHYELINYNEYGTRSSDLVHRVRNLIKTAPKELSPNYQTSSVISELCDSPPKRLMKMLSKRHEDLSHMTSRCDRTSLHFTRNDKILVDKTDSSFNLITVNHSLPSHPSSTSSSTSTWMTINNSSTQSSSSHESPVLLTDSLSVVTKDFLKLSKNNNLLVH
ncbi:uncharacterized protein DC041_0008750, partial [Schistosoma bovis]